jgi:ABC-type bacteriocin/lantibiotic exporter with double-glycine peptidase domain
MSTANRRRVVPETIQTSGMDCGPAALRSLLAGFGLRGGYGGLREACRTDVDGTSIEALEAAADALGLDCVQVMLPPDHVIVAGLPSLAVVLTASGLPHFVIAWRAHRGWVQVMDPGVGRRLVRARAFTDWLYRHEQKVPAEGWAAYARSQGFRAQLAQRIRALGAGEERAEQLVGDAIASGWRRIAALDAAVRTLARTPRRERGPLRPRLQALIDDPGALPADAWFARPLDDEDAVLLRGAVLLSAAGPAERAPDPEALSPELRAALLEPTSRPAATLAAAAAIGRVRASLLGLGALLAGGASVALYVVLEGITHSLSATSMTPAVLVAVAGVAIELCVAIGLFAAGGRLESGLRAKLVAKLRLLPDGYLRSRPDSDLAARAHMLYQLRGVPVFAGGVLTVTGELVATAAGLIVLRPAGAWLVVLAIAACAGIAVAVVGLLREREQRLRDHATALSQLELDAVLASLPARSLRAQRALSAEHGVRLHAWREAALAAGRARTLTTLVQSAVGAAVTIALVLTGASHVRGEGSRLLFVVLALSLGLVGQQITALTLHWPALRALALRLCEPLDATAEPGALAGLATATAAAGGCELSLRQVEVRAAGRVLLGPLDLRIAAGEHVALVGPSGSGKSTLLSLALGFMPATAGDVTVDGAALDRAAAEALWPDVAWVDPQVRVWNASLADNVADPGSATPSELDRVLEAAELGRVAARVGDQPLGDDGGLLSGGEAQRVRFARAFARPRARLVVLDEALRGLDRGQRHRLLGRAREQWAQATLLCATHDVGEALAFDRVIVLDGGQVVEDGDPRVLARDPGSRLTAMIAAERTLRDQLDGGQRWRRLRVEDAGITAHGARPASTSAAPRAASPPAGASDEPARPRSAGWLAAFVATQVARQVAFLASWALLFRALQSDTPDTALLGGWAALVVCFAAANPLSTWLESRLTATISGSIHRRMLAGALRIDPAVVRREGPGRTLGRAFEADSLALLAAGGGLQAVIAFVEILAAMWILLQNREFGLGGPLLLTLAAVTAIALPVVAIHARRARDWARGRAALTGRLLELLGGHRSRLIHGEPPSDRAADDYERMGTRLARSSVVLSIAIPGAWTVGALSVIALTFDPDTTPFYELVAVIGATLLGRVGLHSLGSSGLALTTAIVARGELGPLLDATAPPAVPGAAPGSAALTARGLDVFRGGSLILDEVDVELGHGERVLVTGPSGAGKSTLAEALAGLLAPERGDVRGHATLVPQYQDDHVLLSSLAFNLSLGRAWPATDDELRAAERVCEELGLGPLLARMPAGLAQIVGESGWQLSNGERSLLGLARALLHDPDVLVVDESLGPLDPATAQRALRVLDERVHTLVVVTQE